MKSNFKEWHGPLLIIAFLATPAFPGCAPKSEKTPPTGAFHAIMTKSFEEAQVGMGGSKVFCKDSSECHPAVGLLATIHYNRDNAKYPFSVAECTFSLVSPIMVQTNSHCIPDDLKRAGAKITGRATVFFPKITANADPDSKDYPAESADGDEVLAVSEVHIDKSGSMLPDFAYIKLKTPVTRPFLNINHNGLPDESAVTLYGVKPLSNKLPLVGSAHVSHCTTVQNSGLLPDYNRDVTSLISLVGCDLDHGDSGSPIVFQNETRALYQAHLPAASIANAMELSEQLEPSVAIFLGTSLACIQPPGMSNPRISSEDCKASAAAQKEVFTLRLTNPLKAKAEASAERDMQATVTTYMKDIDKDAAFEWTFKRENLTNHNNNQFMTIPKCIVANEGTEAETILTKRLPIWQFRKGWNRAAQYRHEIHTELMMDLTIKYSPAAAHRDGKAKVTLEETSKLLEKPTLMETELSVCE